MDRETFFVGMDLGSFKTSVMASNGARYGFFPFTVPLLKANA
jgi:hypothetical protein